ncbi:MAG: OmpA family protein [Candidatus Fermentibacteraceae bacterium]|nr:OmpA family protein [Candidatus Fermentibacteraceae bacterium]
MKKITTVILLLAATISFAAPSIHGIPGLHRVNSAIPMGFNEMSFGLGLSYWTAKTEYANFIYHSHILPETLLLSDLTNVEHTGRGRFTLTYGVWDYIDLAANASYFTTFFERGLYVERTTGHWEQLYGFEGMNLVLHGGYDPVPSLKDVLWFGGDIQFGFTPADTAFLRVEDEPDGEWHTGQLMSTLRRPFTTTGNNSFAMDFLITGDFSRWIPNAPAKAHINIGFANYKQNYHFTDFRVMPSMEGWTYSDSTLVDLEVSDNVFNLGLGLEVATPNIDIYFEYTKQNVTSRDNSSVSYFTPGIRFKNNSGTFLDCAFDLSTNQFDPTYYDLGHELYQSDTLVTAEERAERAPLPIGGVFDWGVTLTLGYSSDLEVSAEQSNMGILSGTVTDSLTGEAVFATVTFPGMPVGNVTSDGVTGAYAHIVPEGEIPVTVVAPGYRNASAMIELEAGDTVTLDFALLPNLSTVTGSVRDGEGMPIAGASITIGSPTPVIVTTDGSGVFTADVEAGTWPIAVQAEGYLTDSRSVTLMANETVNVSFDLRDALRAGSVMSFDNIYFASGSATLKPESFPILDSVAILMRDNPTARIQISGHTDSDGSDAFNQTLSENRAQSVYQYLVSTGIAGSRLTTIGYGESVPVAPNDSPANKAKNRRIEFTVLSI